MPLALLALLLVQFNFGVLPALQKAMLLTLTPWSLFALRTISAAIVFQIIYAVWKRWRKPQLAPAEMLVPPTRFLFLSFLGISANQFLLILALTMTSSVAAVIVVPSITVFTLSLIHI